MKSGYAIVHRITRTEFDVDAGASLSAGFVEIVDASGQPTGAVYVAGVSGAPATLVVGATGLGRTAAHDIAQYRLVYDVDGVSGDVADPTDIAKCRTILGVASVAALTGARAPIVASGVLAYASGFSSGPLYLGASGAITHVAPTTGVFVRIGYVLTSALIMVRLESPIVFT